MIEFTLNDSHIEFTLSNEPINFTINAVSEEDVTPTGIFDDTFDNSFE